ncbi:MAG: sigma factor-like helix-turn-helix DNA-binding protein [Eubacteriales bacterium]|jgi:predicted DNA-binding protein YlxM (UPF0122 family)
MPDNVKKPLLADMQHVRITKLYDIYGGVLSERQREAMELWVNEDLSLSEIGDSLDLTRAGAHDRITKACAIIEDLESKLGLLSKTEKWVQELRTIISLAEETDGGEKIAGMAQKLLDEM